MPWKEMSSMAQRDEMIKAYASGWTVMELAAHYGVSRKTIYKWLHRFNPDDSGSLCDRSRAPICRPHRTPDDIRDALVRLRVKHPFWGPRKLLAVLGRRRADLSALLPAASTAGVILKENGLVPPRRHRRLAEHPGSSPLVASGPNAVWCADYKGQFMTKDACWCYPLTITDAFSRYIVLCDGEYSTSTEVSMAAMERLFREVGLPDAIRTDNGAPFACNSLCGLSKMSAWWLKLGIQHQRIRPGKPQENPTHERMHRTLKQATARPPAANMEQQRKRFDDFVREFNHERPHEALNMQTPAALWTPSLRAMPETLPKPEYQGHMEVRSVRHDGCVKFKGQMHFLSLVVARENVAFEEVDDGVWAIRYFHACIGRYNEQDKRITPPPPYE